MRIGDRSSDVCSSDLPNVSRLNELMIVGPITVRSACSHHLCPIMGKIWIGVLPNTDAELIGLSNFARLCDWIMSRPQIQEEAAIMLADDLERRIRSAEPRVGVGCGSPGRTRW